MAMFAKVVCLLGPLQRKEIMEDARPKDWFLKVKKAHYPQTQRKKMDETKQLEIVKEGEYVGSNLPVTRGDFDTLIAQRQMLVEFVAKQMRKDVDYGTIPGTPKPTLYKPGAEKLSKLFGLSVKFETVDKTIDKAQNFAMFTYKATLTHIKSGQPIAECEASCNSQEKKYKERTVWIGKQRTKEPTPIFDILNTLQKMAQKRAMVGGVILAVGASDFFTQDMEDIADAEAIGVTPEVRDVPSSIPNVTRVSSAPAIRHDAYLAEALTTFDEKEMVKEAGFQWDKISRKWMKEITSEDAANLPFRTKRVE